MKNKIIIFLIISFFITAKEKDLKSSKIKTIKYQSEILNKNWKYKIYLPENYDFEKESYPVIYLLHGHGGSTLDWPGKTKGDLKNTLDDLITNKKIEKTLAVIVQAKNSWYIDSFFKMESSIINELIPNVEKNFRVKTDRENRYIGGLSAGGYGSLRFIIKFPELFSGGIILSPAAYHPLPPLNSSSRIIKAFQKDGKFSEEIWKKNNYVNYLESYKKKKIKVNLFIFSGDDDEFGTESVIFQIYENLKLHSNIDMRIVDGGHTWDLWKNGLKEGLRYIYK